jgi:Arm domain-containing DNA-binding protein/integrase-like protein
MPAKGNELTRDTLVKGYAACVTAADSRSLVLNYYNRLGTERRYTIGRWPDWSVPAGREEARRLKRLIDQGGDPLAEIEAERGAPMVDDLIKRFLEEHVSRKRPHTQYDYRNVIERHIRPALGRMKVAAVDYPDADALHWRVTKSGSPIAANRVVAVGSKMFALAIKWRMRTDNPFKSIERNPEHKRKRYPTREENVRLTKAIDEHPDQQAATSSA